MGNAGADKDIRTLHCIGKTACYFARVGDLGKLLLVACQTRGAARDQNAVFIYLIVLYANALLTAYALSLKKCSITLVIMK